MSAWISGIVLGSFGTMVFLRAVRALGLIDLLTAEFLGLFLLLPFGIGFAASPLYGYPLGLDLAHRSWRGLFAAWLAALGAASIVVFRTGSTPDKRLLGWLGILGCAAITAGFFRGRH